MTSLVIVDKLHGSSAQASLGDLTLANPSLIQIEAGPEQISSTHRVDNNLVITFTNGQLVIVENFFVIKDGKRSELLLKDSDEVLWWAQYNQPWSEFYFAEINPSEAPPAALVDGEGFNWTYPLLGLLGAGIVAGALADSGSDDTSNKPPAPNPPTPNPPALQAPTATLNALPTIDTQSGQILRLSGTLAGEPGTVPHKVTVSIDGVDYSATTTPNGQWFVDVPATVLTPGTQISVIGQVTHPADGRVSPDSAPATADVPTPDAQPSVLVSLDPATGLASFTFSEAIDPASFSEADLQVTGGYWVTGSLTAAPGDTTGTRYVGRVESPLGGQVTLQVVDQSYSDLTGNLGSSGIAYAPFPAPADTSAPQVSVSVDPTTGQVTFSFSEAIDPASFSETDVSVSGGTLIPGSLAPHPTSPNTWIAQVTAPAGGTLLVTVPDQSYHDLAGNGGTSGTGRGDFPTPPDTTPPSVTIAVDPNSAQVTFSFSEPLDASSFSETDIIVDGAGLRPGTLAPHPTLPNTWIAELIAPPSGGAVIVSLPDGSYTDAAQNPGSGAAGRGDFPLPPDTTAPSVAISLDPTTGVLTFVFSEPIDSASFTESDLHFTHGSAIPGSLQQDPNNPTHWTLATDFTGAPGELLVVDLPHASYTDSAGNSGSGGNLVYPPAADTVPPTVSVEIDPTSSSVSFIFSEAIDTASFSETDLVISGANLISGSLRADPSDSTGTRFIANLQAPQGGAVVVSVKDQSYQDLAGNLGAAGSDREDFPLPPDTTAPSVTVSIDPQTGQVSFSFSEAIDPASFSASDLVITGATLVPASLQADPNDTSGTRFIATVDAPAGGAVTVSVQDQSYTDLAGNLGHAGSGRADFPVPADTTAPSLRLDLDVSGTQAQATLVFSEAIDPASLSEADLTILGGHLVAGSLRADPSDTTGTRYLADLVSSAGSTLVVAVADNSYSDRAGNPGTGASVNAQLPLPPDTTAPSVVIAVDAETGTATFSFSEIVSHVDAQAISVSNAQMDAASLKLDPSDSSGTRWIANLTHLVGAEGDSVTVEVNLSGQGYQDLAGNFGSDGRGSDTLVIDTAGAPSVTVKIDPATGDVLFSFSEPVTPPREADLQITGATLVPGSFAPHPSVPNTYVAVVNPIGNHGDQVTVGVSVPQGSYHDRAGNAGSTGSDSKTVTLPILPNTQAPSVVVDLDAQSERVTFTFDEAINPLSESAITISGGRLVPGTLVQDPNNPLVWSAAVHATGTPGASHAVTVSLPAGSYTDLAGNLGSGNQDTETLSAPHPASAVISVDAATGEVVFSFSRDVSTIDANQISVSGSTLIPGSLQQDPTDPSRWTARVSDAASLGGHTVAITVTLPTGAYTDAKYGLSGTGASDNDSLTGPTASIDAGTGTLVANRANPVTVTFDQAVDPASIDITDLSVSAGAVTGAALGSFDATSLIWNSDHTGFTVDFTPSASARGESLHFAIANTYEGANGLDGAAAATLNAQKVNHPPTLSVTVAEDVQSYDFVALDTGFANSNAMTQKWDVGSWNNLWPDFNAQGEFMDLRQDGGSHQQTLKQPTTFSEGQVLAVQLGWNNGWNNRDDGGTSRITLSYADTALFTLNTPDRSSAGTTPGDAYGASERFASLTAAPGIELSLDGGATWSSSLMLETWRPEQKDVTITAADLSQLMVRGMALDNPTGKLNIQWLALGHTADDIQFGQIAIGTPQVPTPPLPPFDDVDYDADTPTLNMVGAVLTPLTQIAISDLDSATQVQATLITLNNFSAGDQLWIDGMNAASGSLTVNGKTVTYTLSGSASQLTLRLDAAADSLAVSDWNQLLADLHFGTTGTSGLRELSIRVNDGLEYSAPAEFGINVITSAPSGAADLPHITPLPALSPSGFVVNGADLFANLADLQQTLADSPSVSEPSPNLADLVSARAPSVNLDGLLGAPTLPIGVTGAAMGGEAPWFGASHSASNPLQEDELSATISYV